MKHLERALDKQNQGWKYFLVFLIALFIGQSFGAIPLFIVIGYKSIQNGGSFEMPNNIMDFSSYGVDPNFGLFLMVIPFLVTLVLAVLLVKAFHQRTLKDVINGGTKFRWNRFWVGSGIWAIIMVVSLIIALLIDPDNFEF